MIQRQGRLDLAEELITIKKDRTTRQKNAGKKAENPASDAIVEKLIAGGMRSMADIFQQQENDEGIRGKGYYERFDRFADELLNQKKTRSANRRKKQAKFALPSAHIGGILKIEGRKVDIDLIIELGKCKYIEQGIHVIIQGAAGSGKTYAACALGVSACDLGFKVLYLRMTEFLNNIVYAQEQKCLLEYINALNKFDLLIMDEWLTRPITEEEIYPLMDFLEYRCGREDKKSIIFCTHFERDDWYARVVGRTGAYTASGESCLDRIIHNCYCVTVSSNESLRKLTLNSEEKDQ